MVWARLNGTREQLEMLFLKHKLNMAFVGHKVMPPTKSEDQNRATSIILKRDLNVLHEHQYGPEEAAKKIREATKPGGQAVAIRVLHQGQTRWLVGAKTEQPES
jgi:hypothetical protein